jgi:heme exporter protein A
MMIETRQITKSLGDKLVLRGVDLSVKRGEAVALLGSNGAGKSTWLKIAAGLLQPTSGEVVINSQVMKKEDYTNRKLIGYLGHRSFLYEAFTSIENLQFFARLYNIANPDERINHLIDAVGLSFFKHEPVRLFSRGMIQRLAIARSLLHDPEILLLDEPHTGLDQQGVAFLNELLLKLKTIGVTLIMVTHDFYQINGVCDRAVVLKKGEISQDENIVGRPVEWIQTLYAGKKITC